MKKKIENILNEYDSQTGFGIDGATEALEQFIKDLLKEERIDYSKLAQEYIEKKNVCEICDSASFHEVKAFARYLTKIGVSREGHSSQINITECLDEVEAVIKEWI